MDLEKRNKILYYEQYINTMRPVFNTRALFSDTTAEYVNPVEPDAFSKVKVRFRTAKNNVDYVLLVWRGNKYLMTKVETAVHFDYY